MAWDDLITSARQGKLPDRDHIKKAGTPKSKPSPLGIFKASVKAASVVENNIDQIMRKRAADDWLDKTAFIDASQMGGAGGMPPGGGAPPPDMMGGMPPGGGGMPPEMMGGGMPPMDPMMGGMPPGGGMPPEMMGGGMPPMDPMMMQGMMGGGGGGAGGIDPATGKPVKMKVEDIIVKEVGRVKEMLNSLFEQLGLRVPMSVVDSQEMARALIEQQKRDAERKQIEGVAQDSIPGNPRINPIEDLMSQSNKIGSFTETVADNTEKIDAILRHFKNKK